MKRQVSKINIYPIKSLDGYAPQTATIQSEGFEYDRRWMLVDKSGVFISQRQIPKMTLLAAQITHAGYLHIYVKSNPAISISIAIDTTNNIHSTVTVWGEPIEAVGVSAEADTFFSAYLGIECRLVKYNPQTPRIVTHNDTQSQHRVGFADAMPYLLIGEASLRDLNSRLSGQYSDMARRFRPNIVFKSITPYEEDTWQGFTIGQVRFSRVKKCGRCVMVNLNPDTALAQKEVLATLASYRKEGNKVAFGDYFAMHNPIENTKSNISIGDELIIY